MTPRPFDRKSPAIALASELPCAAAVHCRTTIAATLLGLAAATACARTPSITSPLTRQSTTSPSSAVLVPTSQRGKDVIAPVLATLEREVETRSPGTELGLAVYDFTTREYAGIADETPHVSASAAKAIWVAAALRRVGVEPVLPHAKPIFETSSNDDATEVIKLAGPEALNAFYTSAGMKKSGFTQWFGQAAPDSPRLLGNDNYVTAKDATTFLVGVHDATALDASSNAALREWLTWTPRSGFGGWLGTLLPESVRATLEHKAGWLPPPYRERSVNEIGLVKVADDHAYAIAILARHGADYDAEQAFVEHASCEVFRAASSARIDCR